MVQPEGVWGSKPSPFQIAQVCKLHVKLLKRTCICVTAQTPAVFATTVLVFQRAKCPYYCWAVRRRFQEGCFWHPLRQANFERIIRRYHSAFWKSAWQGCSLASSDEKSTREKRKHPDIYIQIKTKLYRRAKSECRLQTSFVTPIQSTMWTYPSDSIIK